MIPSPDINPKSSSSIKQMLKSINRTVTSNKMICKQSKRILAKCRLGNLTKLQPVQFTVTMALGASIKGFWIEIRCFNKYARRTSRTYPLSKRILRLKRFLLISEEAKWDFSYFQRLNKPSSGYANLFNVTCNESWCSLQWKEPRHLTEIDCISTKCPLWIK